MSDTTDVLVFGTGAFAARIVLDIAAVAERPLGLAVAGRNVERREWLRAAGNARAANYQRPVKVTSHHADLAAPNEADALISRLKPKVVVQAASAQTSAVIAAGANAWTRLVAEGGLSATAVFNALFSVRVARAIKTAKPDTYLVNCCYADVTNSLIAALGLPVTCGVGNVAMLATGFSGELGIRRPGVVKVLANYQSITPFRHPAAERKGPVPRVWIEGREVADVYARFANFKLTLAPAIEISGANGVPLMLAMAAGTDCLGHTPGPNGLPGGYPVKLGKGQLDLDLPPGLGRDEAIAWNAAFEARDGMAVGADGQVRYAGVLHEKFKAVSPEIAKGFHVRDLEAVFRDMEALRARLQARA